MKALVVDDDRVLADLVSFTLRRSGYEVIVAGDARSAMQRWTEGQFDLIMLDVNLPGTTDLQDGFAICRRIRSESDVPIIMLTVRGEEKDIVYGLEAGADDYILKPFSPRQLVARVQAVMRRAHPAGTARPTTFRADGLEFNPKLREVTLDAEEPKTLTQLESKLLEAFMINSGQAMTFEDLINDVWGPGGASAEMLRQLVKRLRTKVEKDPANPQYIQNLPGLGYAFLLKR